MSFKEQLKSLRPLLTRVALVAGLCIGGLFWIQSHAEPEFRAAIDDASPPSIQLSFEASEDGNYYPEYFDPAARTGAGEWIPIHSAAQYFHAGKNVAFIQIPGEPTPKSRILRMVAIDKIIKPTIFPASATVCPVQATGCPAKATACVAIATVCPTVAVTTCPVKLTACATARTLRSATRRSPTRSGEGRSGG